MYDVLFMGCRNALPHLKRDSNGFLALQIALVLYIILKGDALNQLHHNIMVHILIHYIINTYNIGMGQARRRLGLHLELAYKILVKGKFLF